VGATSWRFKSSYPHQNRQVSTEACRFYFFTLHSSHFSKTPTQLFKRREKRKGSISPIVKKHSIILGFKSVGKKVNDRIYRLFAKKKRQFSSGICRFYFCILIFSLGPFLALSSCTKAYFTSPLPMASRFRAQQKTAHHER